MARILVAGGGGFVGSHLAEVLHKQNHTVRVADVHFNGFQESSYYDEKLELDLRSFESCLIATRGMDEVYNLAANMGGIGFITSVGAEIMHDNLLINAHMLEACRANKVKKYLFSSSACVYPDHLQTKTGSRGLRERDAYPANPDSFYGWEKLAAEKLCEAYRRDRGMDIKIARYHNVYGPRGTYKGGREKSPAALCRKVAEASDPGTIEVWGDGKQTRSYCYVDDAVSGTIRLMKSRYAEPVNIGSDRLVSVDQLVDIIVEISGKRIVKRHNLKAPQGVRGRNADISTAKKVLGWEPKVPLETGLASTYAWISDQLRADAQKEMLMGRSSEGHSLQPLVESH